MKKRPDPFAASFAALTPLLLRNNNIDKIEVVDQAIKFPLD
jgi:hypothetical protein